MKTPTDCALTVKACAHLHNLCIDRGVAIVTRETQRDPDLEPIIQRNALKYLLNAVKRNHNRVYKAYNRPVVQSVYQRGVAKRNQILREQFGDRSVRIGPPKPPKDKDCLLYTSPSPRDKRQSRMPSSA